MKGLLNSGQGQMQGSCKHCNEPQFHKNLQVFCLHKKLLKKHPTPWS